MSLRPLRWLLYTPIAALPFLAALLHQGPRLEEDLRQRITANLAAAGAQWAQVKVSGRDVRLSGDAPTAESADAAHAAVLATPGVRLVKSSLRAPAL